MRMILVILAGLAGAGSSVLWYTPGGSLDVKTATMGAGLLGLVCAALMSRLIYVLQRRQSEAGQRLAPPSGH